MLAINYRQLMLLPLLATTFTTIAAAQQPLEGVMLLKHGTTLSGFITRTGDQYVVLLGDSGEAKVPASDVVAVVGNLEEAYQYKRSKLDSSLAARIQLVQWCLQRKMPARAADQLLAAERRFGPQPQLESLHQRLLASNTPTATSTKVVERVSFEQAVPKLTSSKIDTFTSTVQPLLLNRCASGGCHNTRGTSDFILFRPYLGQRTTRRLTERNLAATIAYVDRATPRNSLLLQMATATHGGSESAAIDEQEQKQLDVLESWVKSLKARRRQQGPTTITPVNDLLFQSNQSSGQSLSDAPAPPANSQRIDNASEATGDPFDPDRFNQRHHGRIEAIGE